MKITDNRQKIIELVRLLMSGGVVLDRCEPITSLEINGISGKKKCQSIKATFGIPHDCISENAGKENVSVFQQSFIFPFAIIPNSCSSQKAQTLSLQSKNFFDDELKKYPKIESALTSLMNAIKDELGD